MKYDGKYDGKYDESLYVIIQCHIIFKYHVVRHKPRQRPTAKAPDGAGSPEAMGTSGGFRTRFFVEKTWENHRNHRNHRKS